MAQEFRIVVVIDPKGAKRGGKQVENTLKRTSDAADRLRSNIVRAFTFTAGIIALRRVVRVLASFEQEMATVRAVTGATEDQFRALREEAQRLGATTRFTATQAAEGLVFLARAGFEANEALELLEDTLLLAQAGNLGLGRAADIATNVLKAFRLEVRDLAEVVDVLALAANSSNTTVEQLGDGIKLVGPIAAGLGVSLQETTAAIGALSNAGLQATLAGTGLRRVLAELESPSNATRAIFDQLKVSADEVKVSQVGLTAALKRLKEAGIDTGLALEIFGQRGGPAFEVLSNSIPDVIRLEKELNKAGGTAQRIADIMDENLNGALLKVKSAAEAVILALGDTGGTIAFTSALLTLASALRLMADNADILAVALTAVSAALVVKLFPNLVAATAAFIKLQIAVASGSAVVLGSVEAIRQQAVAELAAASATAADTAARLANTQATLANAVVVQGSAQSTFAHAAVTRQLSILQAENVVATNAVTVAQGRLATATAATTVKARILNTTIAINPFVALIAGAAAAVVVLKRVTKELKEINELNEQDIFSGLTPSAQVGQEIIELEAMLENLRSAAVKFGVSAEDSAGPIASLEGQLAELRAEQERLIVISGAVERARRAEELLTQKGNVAVAKLVKTLNDEAKALKLGSKEREVFTELLEFENKLREDGIKLEPGQKKELKTLLERNQLLRDQAAVLDDLRGPQEEFQRGLAAIEALQESGKFKDGERTEALKKLREQFEGLEFPDIPGIPRGGSEAPSIAGELAELREQAELLKLGADERERVIELRRVEDTLKKAGIDLSAAENTEDAKAIQAQIELNQKLRIRAQIVEEVTGGQLEFIRTQEALNALILEGGENVDLYVAALGRLKQQASETGTTITDGLARAIDGFRVGLETTADVMDTLFSAALNRTTDALSEFITTGTIDFKEFARSLIADISKVISKLLLLAAIDAAFGLEPGTSAKLASRQLGGPVDQSRAFVVGERGRELFQPPSQGRIIPNRETERIIGGQSQVPVVNIENAPPAVNITNQLDSREVVTAGLSTPEGVEMVLNIISKNRSNVKRTLS